MYGIVIYFSFLSGQAFAECKKPVQAVETKRQEELSGEMSATVLNFGGGVSKGKKPKPLGRPAFPVKVLLTINGTFISSAKIMKPVDLQRNNTAILIQAYGAE